MIKQSKEPLEANITAPPPLAKNILDIQGFVIHHFLLSVTKCVDLSYKLGIFH